MRASGYVRLAPQPWRTTNAKPARSARRRAAIGCNGIGCLSPSIGSPAANSFSCGSAGLSTDTAVGVAIVNHGSPENSASRPSMKLIECSTGVARYFLGKQLIVAFPLRRGYGETGGTWAESYGSCNRPNFVPAGLATAADIGSVVDYVRATALRPRRPRHGIRSIGRRLGDDRLREPQPGPNSRASSISPAGGAPIARRSG